MALDLLDDMDACFGVGDFDEEVTYVPLTGDQRVIRAVVTRNVPEPIAENKKTSSPVLIVEVRNSATLGISSAEIDLGGDKISLPVRVGKTAESRPITQILSQDTGTLRLELR